MQLIKELLEMHTKRSSFAKFSHLNSPFSLSLSECLEFEIVIVTLRTSKSKAIVYESKGKKSNISNFLSVLYQEETLLTQG